MKRFCGSLKTRNDTAKALPADNNYKNSSPSRSATAMSSTAILTQRVLLIVSVPRYVLTINLGRFPIPYSWIADQRDAKENLICQQIRRVTAILRPPFRKLSGRRIQIYPDYCCLDIILKVILNNFQNNA